MTIPTVNRSDMWTRFPAATFFSDPTVGLSYFSHFHSFIPSTTQGQGEFNTAIVNTGTAQIISGDDGLLQLNAGSTTAGNGITLLQPADVINLTLNNVRRRFLIEARLGFSVSANLQFFFGLSTRDTTLISGGANTSDDHFGYEMSAASQTSNPGQLQFVSEKANVRTTKANIAPASSSWMLLGIEYDANGYLVPWVNGVRKDSHIITTNIPDNQNMSLHIVCQSNGISNATVRFDWLQWALFE
jgi:hypothetical protein